MGVQGFGGLPNKGPAPPSVKVKPPIRVADAARIVDKNSRTQVKLCQLLEIMVDLKSSPGKDSDFTEKENIITKKILKLQHRLNRRLQKLAKWADHPADNRWKDLRPPIIRQIQQRPVYNRPVVAPVANSIRPAQKLTPFGSYAIKPLTSTLLPKPALMTTTQSKGI